jgi:hypothetical protein
MGAAKSASGEPYKNVYRRKIDGFFLIEPIAAPHTERALPTICCRV